jgi:hypothetical protein
MDARIGRACYKTVSSAVTTMDDGRFDWRLRLPAFRTASPRVEPAFDDLKPFQPAPGPRSQGPPMRGGPRRSPFPTEGCRRRFEYVVLERETGSAAPSGTYSVVEVRYRLAGWADRHPGTHRAGRRGMAQLASPT